MSSNLPPGATCEDIDRSAHYDAIADEAESIARDAVDRFNECPTQQLVTHYRVPSLQLVDDCDWSLRIVAPCDAKLGKHYIVELSIALMAFAIALQMEAER